MTFIYNGRDYNPLRSDSVIPVPSDNYNVGYIGAINESKGFHWVVKAWPDIKRKFPEAKLIAIGSIKTHNIHGKTGSLGISDPAFEDNYIKPILGSDPEEIRKNGVRFTGHISPKEISVILETLAVGIVNPNLNECAETFCVSAIDFQAHNVPVVGGNSLGLKETVAHGKTGLLVNDSKKLNDAVITLLQNRQRLNLLRSNCSSFVREKFSRANTRLKWLKLIDDVLQDEPNRLVNLKFSDISFKTAIKEVIRLKNQLA